MDDRLLLLGLLHQQEMHGYQLYEFIDRSLAACTDLKKPAAYYLLNKMAQDNWIAETTVQEGNRPPRKVYRTTEQGEEAFRRLLRGNLAAYVPATFAGDIGLAFLTVLEPNEVRDLLQKRRVAIVTALDEARSIPDHQGGPQWIIEHQRRHLAAELDWTDHVIASLQNTTTEEKRIP
jgi:DNA-binding PadR family transcriptional regulator